MDSYIEKDENIDLNNYFEGINELYTYEGAHYAIPKGSRHDRSCTQQGLCLTCRR